MLIYTLKRLLLALAVTLVVSALSFGLLYLSGDPAAAVGGVLDSPQVRGEQGRG